MPTPDEEKLRDGLLSQLRYLAVEAEALRGIIERVPEEVLTSRPPGAEYSIQELFGLLIACDEAVHRPRLKRMMAEDAPAFDAVDEHALACAEDWNAMPTEVLLERVGAARRALADVLEDLPPEAWTRTAHFPAEDGVEERDVYEFAHAVCLHDAEHLRRISQRVYESQPAIPSPISRQG